MITENNVAHDDLGTARRWRAALYLGLISSTFSTVASQLAAARIGRDAAVDWMSVAAIPARDWAMSVEPSVSAIAVGIAFHQSADISWALVFFGVLGKWTARLGPASLALAAVPWAILTSAFEWFILVPLFPFWQPIFTLQQPYWIGFLVHLSSASMYPLFAWLRRSASERGVFEGRTFLRVWSFGAINGTCCLWSPPRSWPPTAANCHGPGGIHPSIRPSFGICRPIMSKGSSWRRLPRSERPTRTFAPFRSLWRRVKGGEARILAHWWTSWFGEPIQICSAEERAAMPGLLDAADIANLQSIEASSFDGLFIDLMTRHHKGAVAMADLQLRGGSDPRLKIMAQAIRHEQQGEIALMHGINGVPAVSLAIRNMFADRVNRGQRD